MDRLPVTATGKDHAACSGCSLCLLVCPVWRRTHDPRMTPEGRAKALQHGAMPSEIAASIESCTLCGACEPVCPEEIDLVGMTLDLRTRLADAEAVERAHAAMKSPSDSKGSSAAPVLLVPGPALLAQPDTLSSAVRLVGAKVSADTGHDVLEALRSGVPVPEPRRRRFLAHLQAATTLIVEDGVWIRFLREWLPGMQVLGLGEALTRLQPVRRHLRKGDMYIIESRAYHRDYQRLVKHYDRLRVETGCAMNLDLQRIAIPAAGQSDWILKGIQAERIVVESMEDAAQFDRHGLPVVHVAELADH